MILCYIIRTSRLGGIYMIYVCMYILFIFTSCAFMCVYINVCTYFGSCLYASCMFNGVGCTYALYVSIHGCCITSDVCTCKEVYLCVMYINMSKMSICVYGVCTYVCCTYFVISHGYICVQFVYVCIMYKHML